MLAFRVHKEKEGLARFSKELSGTVKTIKQLQERGVEVFFRMTYAKHAKTDTLPKFLA